MTRRHVRTLHQPRSTVRTFSLRPETIDEQERSVEAVLATDGIVTAFDLESWEPVDEVLVMDGWEPCEQCIVVDSHPQKRQGFIRSADVHGSARNIRVEGRQLVARLYFADDPESLALWGKVRARHVRDLSIGSAPLEQSEIPTGQTAQVGGTTYTARERPLLITSRWELGEVSVCPHGADPKAKIRQRTSTRSRTMSKLREFLEEKGLSTTATDEEAKDFVARMEGADKEHAEGLRAEEEKDTQVREGTDDDPEQMREGSDDPEQMREDPESGGAATRSRSGRRGTTRTRGASTRTADLGDQVRAAVRDTIKEERTRTRQIEELAGSEVSETLRQKAINEGWSVDKAAREFLGAIRAGRGQHGETTRGTAIHSRSREENCTVRALGMALMIRSGRDPIKNYARYEGGTYRPVHNIEKDETYLRAAEDAWQYRDWSLPDVCREAVRLDGKHIPTSRAEMIREAISGSSLDAIFTQNFSAEMLAAFQDAEDSTQGWVSESDVPNFQTNERAKMGKFGALSKHKRGGTAEHLGTSDEKEEYKIARYSGKFVVDEMDIIDDRFGALEQHSPMDIGLTARQLRPNLVYAIILRNQALADNVALFHAATHKNLITDAFGATGVQALITLFGKQRQEKRPLNLRMRYLLVPQDLFFQADIVLTSAERIIAADSGGTKNPLSAMGITLRVDDRLGTAGVVDPVDDTQLTGTATNFFGACRPGENGAKTIEVGYLRGTGRAPTVRSFILDKGQWGIGWDVNYDLGAKALAHQCLAKSTGAGGG